MATPIPRLQKGRAPTFMEERLSNQVIDLLNALLMVQVKPDGAGKVLVGERNIIIDISALASDINKQLTTITNNQTTITNQIQQLLSAMQGASATAGCNEDGTITITITFPGI